MNKNTIELLKLCIHNAPAPAVTIDESVIDDLTRHALLTLPADYLAACETSRVYSAKSDSAACETSRGKYRTLLFRQLQRYYDNLHEQEEITRLLRAEGLTPVILKGMSAALYYDKPENRPVGDIDILLQPNSDESFEKARQILLKNGFVETPDHRIKRHIGFERNGVIIELHWYFSAKRSAGERRLDKLLDESEPVLRELAGSSFYSYDDLVNGIVILQHIQHHLDIGLGFRQIIDWFMFAKSQLYDNPENLKTYLELAEYVGLSTPLAYVQRLGELYFDMPRQEFAAKADDATVRELFELVSAYGNFGHNQKLLNAGVGTVLRNGILTPAELQRRGLKHMEEAKIPRAFKPFAWAYQLGRYVNRGLLKRTDHDGALSDNLKEIKERHALLEKLKVGRYRK